MFFSLNAKLHSENFNIVIDNTVIDRVTSTKFLGVYIDSKLTWSAHIAHISKKISKSIGIINKIKTLLDESTLRTIYNTLVLPYLMYCHLIWGNCAQTNLNRIIVLQKKCIRFVTNSPFLAHTDPLFSRLNVIKIQNLYTYLSCILIYKLRNNLCPPSFSSVIDLRLTFHNVNTRYNAIKYNVPYCRTSLRQRSLVYTIPKLCNDFFVPLNLTASTSLWDLKRKLKLFLN